MEDEIVSWAGACASLRALLYKIFFHQKNFSQSSLNPGECHQALGFTRSRKLCSCKNSVMGPGSTFWSSMLFTSMS